jgi:ribosomal protein S18 acetylase RimI-like enzyme
MALARTGVTGLSLPWPVPRCSAGATRDNVHGWRVHLADLEMSPGYDQSGWKPRCERFAMDDLIIRRGEPADVEPAVAVWLAANSARRKGLTPGAEQAARARGHVSNPEAFLLVAEDAGDVVGMALGMQGLADDGAGPPVRGLCHVSMVFVAPDYWGRGIGGRLVDALLPEARSRGYDRAQLWTQSDNARATRLYEGRGFVASGREKDEFGERIVHYQRALPETV